MACLYSGLQPAEGPPMHIRRIRRAEIAKQQEQVFIPIIDTELWS